MREACYFFFNDFNSAYDQLLEQMNHTSLYNRRIHDMLILIYKSMYGCARKYINDLFSLQYSTTKLKSHLSLIIPSVNVAGHSVPYVKLQPN